MKTEELIGLAIPLAYGVMMTIESWLPARSFERRQNWRWLGVCFLVMVLGVGSVVPLILTPQWLNVPALADLSSWGLWGIPVGVLIATFFGYWLHRAEHHFDWLWRVAHQLHHSVVRVDIASAYITHPVEVLLKVLLATAVSRLGLGLTPLAAAFVGVVGALLSLWQHWNIRTPHWLGYWVPRPESHVLHHERNVHARNYGDLPLWDMLFGTFVNPPTVQHVPVGFAAPGNARVLDMLLMRDVNRA